MRAFPNIKVCPKFLLDEIIQEITILRLLSLLNFSIWKFHSVTVFFVPNAFIHMSWELVDGFFKNNLLLLLLLNGDKYVRGG
jgi:hypothetical protein